MKDVAKIHADGDYWREVGKLIGPDVQLLGFTGRDSALFTHPLYTVNGMIGAALMSLKAELDLVRVT
jgi:hypothetical protein